MKIGIMGGTFDPPHIGHLVIAQCALTRMRLDKIWFMPAGDPPHKESGVTQKEHRKNMIAAAIASNPDFELFTYEMDKERPSYSAVTMTELDEKYPDAEFFFIMGADSLLHFENWYRPDVICAHTALIVANRNNVPQEEIFSLKQKLEQKFNAKIYFMDTPQMEIGSGRLRAEQYGIKGIRYRVPEPVYEYIVEHKLYGEP